MMIWRGRWWRHCVVIAARVLLLLRWRQIDSDSDWLLTWWWCDYVRAGNVARETWRLHRADPPREGSHAHSPRLSGGTGAGLRIRHALTWTHHAHKKKVQQHFKRKKYIIIIIIVIIIIVIIVIIISIIIIVIIIIIILIIIIITIILIIIAIIIVIIIIIIILLIIVIIVIIVIIIIINTWIKIVNKYMNTKRNCFHGSTGLLCILVYL